jgi:CrcB protein
MMIAAAGAVGTLARYGLSGLVQRFADSEFPWGTLTVNLLGSFLFGVVWSVAEVRIGIGPQLRAVGLIGFMGAFTTFSTFSFEAGQMLRDAQWFSAAGYLLAHNVFGILCLLVGMAVGRMV